MTEFGGHTPHPSAQPTPSPAGGEGSDDYGDFLKAKVRMAPASGIELAQADFRARTLARSWFDLKRQEFRSPLAQPAIHRRAPAHPRGHPQRLAAEVAALLAEGRFDLTDEKACQGGMEAFLAAHLPLGVRLQREPRLGPGDIPDFVVGGDQGLGVVIEVKMRSAGRAAVLRQLARYARYREVGAVVLASNKALTLPPSIEGLASRLADVATTGSFTERGEATRQLDLQVRQATGVSKAPFVAAFVRMLVQAGESVILCGWHREVYDIWLSELADLKPAMFTGSETIARKEAEKQRFLDGETGVFIMSLRSGAGVDGLQERCSTLVFGELDWSPGIHHQCIGRLDREGQVCWPDPITVIYLVASDGSDPSMMQTLGLKSSEASQITDPSLGVTRVVSGDGHLKSLVHRYLIKKRMVAA